MRDWDDFTVSDAPPRPSDALMAEMAQAADDPVQMAALHELYRQEIIRAGFDPDKLRPFNQRPAPASLTEPVRGQGKDYAIPVNDR